MFMSAFLWIQKPREKTLELPPSCPGIAKYLFDACTQMNPDDRPSASQIVEWLRHPPVTD